MKKVTRLNLIIASLSAGLTLTGCDNTELDSYENNLYVVNPDASGLREISLDADYISEIDFLPDGSGIKFKSYGNLYGEYVYDLTSAEISVYQTENPDSIRVLGQGDIFLFTGYGADTVNLTESEEYDYDPLLINANTQIVFLTRQYLDEESWVSIVHLADCHTGLYQPVDTIEGNGRMLDYSDDRSLIIYEQNLSQFTRLLLLRASDLTLTEICKTFQTYSVGFNPGQSEILIEAYSGDNHEIFLVNLDTGQKSKLTASAGDDVYPQFTPDYSEVIFIYRNAGKACLRIMDPDGQNLRNLTPEFNGIEAFRISPGGNLIAFTAEPD